MKSDAPETGIHPRSYQGRGLSVRDADYITPATQEQIARQVADAKKFNGNASLWDIENGRVVRTLANDRVRLTEQVKLLREALVMIDKHPTNGNSEPDSMAEALEQIHALAESALEATKEGA